MTEHHTSAKLQLIETTMTREVKTAKDARNDQKNEDGSFLPYDPWETRFKDEKRRIGTAE